MNLSALDFTMCPLKLRTGSEISRARNAKGLRGVLGSRKPRWFCLAASRLTTGMKATLKEMDVQ